VVIGRKSLDNFVGRYNVRYNELVLVKSSQLFKLSRCALT
jgi:hypothetical protein